MSSPRFTFVRFAPGRTPSAPSFARDAWANRRSATYRPRATVDVACKKSERQDSVDAPREANSVVPAPRRHSLIPELTVSGLRRRDSPIIVGWSASESQREEATRQRKQNGESKASRRSGLLPTTSLRACCVGQTEQRVDSCLERARKLMMIRRARRSRRCRVLRREISLVVRSPSPVKSPSPHCALSLWTPSPQNGQSGLRSICLSVTCARLSRTLTPRNISPRHAAAPRSTR